MEDKNDSKNTTPAPKGKALSIREKIDRHMKVYEREGQKKPVAVEVGVKEAAELKGVKLPGLEIREVKRESFLSFKFE